MTVRGNRALRRIGVALAVALGLAVGAGLSYPLWDGFGPWEDLPSGPAPASQTLEDSRFAEVGHLALALLAEHRALHGFPAMTAAVSIDGELVWTGAVGWADLEANVAASRATMMRIGSTSKAVTATALARLIDLGEMSLDAPISTYSDAWPNPSWDRMTPRQLASHTAGLPDYGTNSDRRGQLITLCGCRHYTSVAQSLTVFDGARLIYEPGTDFKYNSFDVNILGAAISASQGESFLRVLDRLVFEPLGLTSSGGANHGPASPDVARFYQVDGDRVRTWRPFDLSQRWPSGGLVSTSADLAMIGGAWVDPEFISPGTRLAMWTPQVLENGQVNEQSYAIGWRYNLEPTQRTDSGHALPYAHHGGVSKGAMSWLVVYPDARLSIALNINTRASEFADFASVEARITELFLSRIEGLSGDEAAPMSPAAATPGRPAL